MNTPITATSIICTCGVCPTQYEIKLSDGRMIYFRYRWGYLSIRVSQQETTHIMDAVGGEEIIGEQIGDGLDGDMEREDACIWIGRAIEKLNPRSTLTDEELQREAEREYPYLNSQQYLPGHADRYNAIVDTQRAAYINGRKKSLERK